ncbi:hypothetical protein AAY473_011427 [Plecturocebus cupreus]
MPHPGLMSWISCRLDGKSAICVFEIFLFGILFPCDRKEKWLEGDGIKCWSFDVPVDDTLIPDLTLKANSETDADFRRIEIKISVLLVIKVVLEGEASFSPNTHPGLGTATQPQAAAAATTGLPSHRQSQPARQAYQMTKTKRETSMWRPGPQSPTR